MSMLEGRAEEATSGERRERKKILVVGKEELFTEEIVNYAIHLAERLDYDILAMNVGTAWREGATLTSQAHLREAFKRRATAVGVAFKRKAAQSDIHCEHVVKFGNLGTAVEELIHGIKRIEFVVTESEASKDEVIREVTIPVFSVVSNSWTVNGGKIMAGEYGMEKRKPVGATIGYGVLTVALYAAVFTHSDTVMQFFTKGGWYAALPIATVFVFSFAHGHFSGHLWSLLGVEAMKRVVRRETEQPVARERKRVQKRPRLSAYIDPFHKI